MQRSPNNRYKRTIQGLPKSKTRANNYVTLPSTVHPQTTMAATALTRNAETISIQIVPQTVQNKTTTTTAGLVEKTLARWQRLESPTRAQFQTVQDTHDSHMLKMSKRYSKMYQYNVYKLNKCTLKIQHWYFTNKSRKRQRSSSPVRQTLRLQLDTEKSEIESKPPVIERVKQPERPVISRQSNQRTQSQIKETKKAAAPTQTLTSSQNRRKSKAERRQKKLQTQESQDHQKNEQPVFETQQHQNEEPISAAQDHLQQHESIEFEEFESPDIARRYEDDDNSLERLSKQMLAARRDLVQTKPASLRFMPFADTKDEAAMKRNEYQDPESWEGNLRSPAKRQSQSPTKRFSPTRSVDHLGSSRIIDDVKEDQFKFVPKRKPKVPTLAELGLTPAASSAMAQPQPDTVDQTPSQVSSSRKQVTVIGQQGTSVPRTAVAESPSKQIKPDKVPLLRVQAQEQKPRGEARMQQQPSHVQVEQKLVATTTVPTETSSERIRPRTSAHKVSSFAKSTRAPAAKAKSPTGAQQSGSSATMQTAKLQYQEYLAKLDKDIHDEKMSRFVQSVDNLQGQSPSKIPRVRQRVDTGLGKGAYQTEDISVSISPTRRRPGKGGFTVKPAEINHFTGKQASPQRNNNSGYKTKKEEEDEITVQVGDKTQIFTYDEEQKPRLIDTYIKTFQQSKASQQEKSVPRAAPETSKFMQKSRSVVGRLPRNIQEWAANENDSFRSQEQLQVQPQSSQRRTRGSRLTKPTTAYQTQQQDKGAESPNKPQASKYQFKNRQSRVEDTRPISPKIGIQTGGFLDVEDVETVVSQPTSTTCNNTTQSSYMKPTKASLNAQKQRQEERAQKRAVSRHNERGVSAGALPSRRPQTAATKRSQMVSPPSSTYQEQQSVAMSRKREWYQDPIDRSTATAAAVEPQQAVAPSSTNKAQPVPKTSQYRSRETMLNSVPTVRY